MKFLIPKSTRTVWVNIEKYKVDWDKKTRSKIQDKVKQFLRPYLIHHIVAEEFRIPRTRLTIDLIDFTTKIAYEVQGEQHSEYVEFFHGNITGYTRQLGRDAIKDRFLEYNGYTLVQIMSEEVPILSREYIKKTFGFYL